MKALKKLSVLAFYLVSNLVVSQDTMYVVQSGGLIGKHPASIVDSIIFYDPVTLDTSIINDSIIMDADRNIYTSVKIGNQVWMKENLRTSKYSDGSPIFNITDNHDWTRYHWKIGAWCNYDNDSQNDSIYGKLYNWEAVKTDKLCPTGWHVPTDSEWFVLKVYLAAEGHNGAEGTVLKATSGWDDDENGTDDYGWLGLPGGLRSPFSGNFGNISKVGKWWSSSEVENNTSEAWYHQLTSSYDYISSEYSHYKKSGLSVRCLKNDDSIFLVNDDSVLAVYGIAEIDSVIFYRPNSSPTITKDLTIGDSALGGIVAYLLQRGDIGYDVNTQHGLIVAPTDQSTGAKWGCSGTMVNGLNDYDYGTGKQNTANILAGCSETNIAAYLCDTLNIGGYSDWFLPSQEELFKLYSNKNIIDGFSPAEYWSSTESGSTRASGWSLDPEYEVQFEDRKRNLNYVRAVRYF